MPGCQRPKADRRSSCNACVRTWSMRWALRCVHCIACRFTIRRLTTWCTVDSTQAVESVSPCRYRFPVVLHRATVADGRRGRYGAPGCQAPEGAQIVDHGVEDAGLAPALALLVHRVPRRQIMRHQTPGHSGADEPPQAIEHLAQALVTLRDVFGHAGHRGGHTGSFVITDN